MSEKTLASGTQMITMAATAITGLAPVSKNIDKATTQFWIDRPTATKRLIERFATKPLVFEIVGARLGPSRGLATLIDCWFGEHFDVFAIDRMVDNKLREVLPYTDIVVVDTQGLYVDAVSILQETDRLDTVVIFLLGNDRTRETLTFGKTVVFDHYHNILKWISGEMRRRLASTVSIAEAELAKFDKHFSP